MIGIYIPGIFHIYDTIQIPDGGIHPQGFPKFNSGGNLLAAAQVRPGRMMEPSGTRPETTPANEPTRIPGHWLTRYVILMGAGEMT